MDTAMTLDLTECDLPKMPEFVPRKIRIKTGEFEKDYDVVDGGRDSKLEWVRKYWEWAEKGNILHIAWRKDWPIGFDYHTLPRGAKIVLGEGSK